MKNLDAAIIRLNEKMNEVLNQWGDRPSDLHSYAFGWREFDPNGIYVVGPNHTNCFHYAENVINIVKAFDCSWYLTVHENADGEPTPCVAFF